MAEANRSIHPFHFKSHIIVFLATALLAAGCATTARNASGDLSYSPEKESIVVGRLVMDLGGQSQGWIDKFYSQFLYLEQRQTGKKYKIKCETGGRDARFIVALPPGDYRVTKWKNHWYETSPTGYLSVESGKIIYVGTIKWTRKKGSIVKFGIFPGQITVLDEFQREREVLEQRSPGISDRILISLIQM